MLGWALKRSLGVGQDTPIDTDDTQIEQPDTPGPVFAARAFKSALFGTPHPNDDTRSVPAPVASTTSTKSVASTPSKDNRTRDDKGTPARPVGILLTPGTGTSRRKRVSFGREVEFGENNKKKELKIDRDHHGGRPSLFSDPKTGTSSTSTRSRNRPRTKLAEALENARRLGAEIQKEEVKEETAEPGAALGKQQTRQEASKAAAAAPAASAAAVDGAGGGDDDEALWEEVDDGAEWDPDVTVDLNEPHSQSGRYWKAQFQNYQEDAKAEMSKLLKYKQLAKSYAKMKDAEAVDLHAKLQEEKEKVTKMEGHITELARQLARGRMKGSDHDYQELISNLTRETAMAVQYRNQVKELETALKNNEAGGEPTEEDLEWAGMMTPTGRRRHHYQQAVGTSPRTQRTLVETQRELRRAREQVKELTQAKEEARRLKAGLRGAEQRVRHYEKENKTLAADVTSAEAAAEAAEARAQDLEKRAKFAEDERRRKDEALRLLQHRYESLKDDAKARVGEAEQVLRRKNEEIAELKERARQLARRSSEPVSERQELRTAALPRYDLRRKQQPQPQKLVEDDFAIRLDDPQLEVTEELELELPQQRLPVRSWREAEDRHDKENISAATKSAVSAVSAMTTASLRPRPKTTKEDVLSTLRRRRGASPLRSIEAPQRGETLRRTRSQTASGDEPKIDLMGNRFARLGDTAERDEQLEPDHLADASRVSIPSERVTAALARLERRRAERRRALESTRRSVGELA